MERWVGRVALVTGASSGIGAAIAEMLVRRGMTVVGCGRDVDRIQKRAESLKAEKGRLHGVRCDLTQEADILAMFGRIKADHGGVDVCVNNAGLAHPAPLLSAPTHMWRSMLDVNVLAPSICTREAFQSMKERNVDDGHIININSVTGKIHLNSAEGHFYGATKWAVSALSEGIRNELRELGTHTRISQISPGIVETEFAYRMRGEERAKAMYQSIKCLHAKDIADAVEYVLSAPPHVQVHDVIVRPTEQKS